MLTALLTLSLGRVEAQINSCAIPEVYETVGTDLVRYCQDDDYAVLFSGEQSRIDLGFIGDDYQRLRVKFLSVIKDPTDSSRYLVYGKNIVKNNVCSFQGAFQVRDVRVLSTHHLGSDDENVDSYIVEQGVIVASYSLNEDPAQKHVGIFRGTLYSFWYRTKNGTIHYDDIEQGADSWSNDQFIGTWSSYDSRTTKVCNWGHARVCDPRNRLDVGVGEFSPDYAYLKSGWLTYHDAFVGYQSDIRKIQDALRIEFETWWKE